MQIIFNYFNKMKKYFLLGLSLQCVIAQVVLMTACTNDDDYSAVKRQKSIVILHENDVHCAIDGYARLAGLRDAIAISDTAWAAVVSSGDFLQGGTAGSVSRGEYIVDVIRNVGYDAITLGNHEFDYGADRMKELLSNANTTVVCSNFFEYGATKPYYASYTIRQYGNRRVAYVGVLTPETMIDEKYSFYDKDDNQLYDLHTDEVIQLVQAAVDEARSKGANYVVLLSHLGEANPKLGISSHELIAATRGIDVVFDGHTHSVIECDEVTDLDGKTVPITQTGTQFANIGKLLITADGHITTTLIATDDIAYKSDRVSTTIDSIYQVMEQTTSRQVATSDFDLTINDANGNRLIRCGETNLGDLVTDAFRQALQADIGLCNGGGIRSGIKAGNITYSDVINVLPYNSSMVKIEATGAQITTMLKYCTALLPEENGHFPQVSGLRYTIHQLSSIVSDVEVLSGDTWQPIDTDKTYTIALTDYYSGGGYYDTLKNCIVITYSDIFDSEALTTYLETTLGGIVPDEYASAQGRITIIDD